MNVARLTVFGALVGASLFAVPTMASADNSPPVLGGPASTVTQSVTPSAPLGSNSPDSLGYTEPAAAPPQVITPLGTVLRSDGVCHSDSVCTPMGTVVRSDGVCQSGAVCSPLGTVMVSDGMGGQVPSTAYYSD